MEDTMTEIVVPAHAGVFLAVAGRIPGELIVVPAHAGVFHLVRSSRT